MSSPSLVTLADIRRAREATAPHLHHTPMATSATLSAMTGCRLTLKQELFQKTGSFKVRGALNRLSVLSDDEKRRGVLTVSAGNHAAGVAWAARLYSVPCTVVMPNHAPRSKLEAVRGYGAEVILNETGFEGIFERVKAIEAERGLLFIPPFDDPRIIAGQGVVGLEIVEDFPEPDLVVVPIGGGGLMSGVAAAVKAASPGTRVVGVEPFGADAMWRSLQSGRPERLERIDTLADGLSAPFAGELTFAHVRALVDEVVRVTDAEIVAAMRLILTRCKLLVEPAAAAATAALLAGRVGGITSDLRVVAILSGGNVDPERLGGMLSTVPDSAV